MSIFFFFFFFFFGHRSDKKVKRSSFSLSLFFGVHVRDFQVPFFSPFLSEMVVEIERAPPPFSPPSPSDGPYLRALFFFQESPNGSLLFFFFSFSPPSIKIEG